MNGNQTPAEAPLADVIHNPRTDWCACEPHGGDRCDYRMLADTVIGKLNPPDRDEAEVSICISAIESIAAFVTSLPCHCSPDDSEEPCSRCAVLGQWHKEGVSR
jgi:hypothetical protein